MLGHLRRLVGELPSRLLEPVRLPADAIQPMDVTYIVRAPDLTPTNNLDNPPICAITFGGKNTPVFQLLDKTAPDQGNTLLSPENVTFASHFHNWFTICRVPAAQVVTGDYIVQVKTTAYQSNLGSTPKTTMCVSTCAAAFTRRATRRRAACCRSR